MYLARNRQKMGWTEATANKAKHNTSLVHKNKVQSLSGMSEHNLKMRSKDTYVTVCDLKK